MTVIVVPIVLYKENILFQVLSSTHLSEVKFTDKMVAEHFRHAVGTFEYNALW